MNYFSVKMSVDCVEVVYAICTKFGKTFIVVGCGGESGVRMPEASSEIAFAISHSRLPPSYQTL